MKQLLVYEIPRRSIACCAGQEAFKPGMTYHTVLEAMPEGFVRKDYCIQCWETHNKQAAVHWKSAIPKPSKVPMTNVVRDERALEIFKRKESTPEEAFVLALYLQRRKKIALRRELTEQSVYEILDTEEIVVINKIPLTHLAIEQIQASLVEKFSMD